MNFLTKKKSLDVFENYIKIEGKKYPNVEQHIGMQLVLLGAYSLPSPDD